MTDAETTSEKLHRDLAAMLVYFFLRLFTRYLTAFPFMQNCQTVWIDNVHGIPPIMAALYHPPGDVHMASVHYAVENCFHRGRC